MEESVFKTAILAISSGEYTDDDIHVAKQWLDKLNQKELSIKRKMEQSKNEFSRKKNKSETELKTLRHDIKQLRVILKNT